MGKNISSKWLIVGVGFMILGLVYTIRSTIGLMMPLWSEEFGWSRSMISSGGALCLIVMAMIAPFAGSAVDKYGPRPFVVGGLLAVAISAVLMATMQSAWMFFIAFSLLSGVGFGVVAMHVIVAAVSPLFDENKGLAVGIATAGSTAGQLLIIPIVAIFLVSFGWRETYIVYAVVCALVALLCWKLLAAPKAKNNIAAHQSNFWQDAKYLVKKPVFHAVFWSFTLCGFTSTGVVETHLMPYLAACGYPTLDGALSYGFLSGFNMIGMMLSGYLSDRMNKVLLLTIIYIMRGLSFIVLMFVVGDYAALALFTVAFGLFDYSTVPVTAGIIVEHLGQKMLGITMGILAAGHALGAAAGAYYGGYLFDLFARYEEMWIASIILAIVAGAISFAIKFMRPTPRMA
ncbi:MAG: MFS transporter [OCS116 cluster bacterium]|uniref:MFS transporter n=1 Tax=OCS116 cluster bacterium TaxID=2030921 RepID=A0A2A4Z317_9PROT|nr:MFS transporter [OCS116 cluster bacterium]